MKLMKTILLNTLLIFSIHVSAQQKEILYDDFNKNKNNWEEGKNELHQKYVKSGFYHIVNHEDSSIAWNSIDVPIDVTQNFAIETSVSLSENKSGEAILIFGANNKTDDFYFFQIRDVDKKYPIQIGKRENGEWKGVWKKANINTKKKYNRLTIKKIGTKLNFLVNGIVIHTQEFESFFGKGLGLGCGGPQHAVFDYIFVLENQTN